MRLASSSSRHDGVTGDFHYVISEVLHQPVRYVWHRERTLNELTA